MSQKHLMVIMTCVLLFGVYLATSVALPGCANKRLSKDNNLSDNNGTDRIYYDGESEEKSLKDKLVVIDVGHGGIDPGNVGVDGILEKDVNLAVALKLKKYLEQNGIKVVMTRVVDEGLYKDSDSNKKVSDLKKRCEIINSNNADVAVSIHQNSYTTSSVKGAQVFYYKNSEKGKKLAHIIQESIRNNLDESNKRVEKSDSKYYMLLNTQVPTVIVECGFLSNRGEAEKLISDEYQDKAASAICSGIKQYLLEE